MPFVTIEGARIFVLERGVGPPALCLHGNPTSSQLWRPVLDRLAPEYRCLAPDLPGYGRSGVPAGFDFGLEAMAAFVARLVAALSIDRPLRLVVHDFGGPYGLAWAVRHPREVSHVAVLNSFFSSRLRWHPWARLWRMPVLGELALAASRRELLRREMRRAMRVVPPGFVDGVYDRLGPGTREAMLRLYRAIDPRCFEGWEERLHELAREVPVRVLWGRHDPYLDLELAASFGTSDVELFDAGHWLPVERPAEVAESLGRLFATSPL